MIEPAPPPPLRALIFDFDGTLADDDAQYQRAWLALLRERGVDARAEVVQEDTRQLGDARMLHKYLGPLSSEAELEALLARRDTLYRRHYAPQVALRPDAREFLTWARDTGLRLAIASASPRLNLHAVLDPTGLTPFFSAIVAREDVRHPKPHPEAYARALAALRLLPDACLAIEDTPAGARAARGAGLRVLGYSPRGTAIDGATALFQGYRGALRALLAELSRA